MEKNLSVSTAHGVAPPALKTDVSSASAKGGRQRSPSNLLQHLKEKTRGGGGGGGGQDTDADITNGDDGRLEGESGRRSTRHKHRHSAEVLTLPPDIKDYDITGTLFKRRGGMGRILGWKPRLFTLYKGKLSYYEGELIEEVDRRKPRGVYDLTARGVAYILHGPSKHENAPTEFLFSIASHEDEQKWRICAPSKDDLEEWCKVLATYLGEPASPAEFPSELEGSRWSINRRRSTAEEVPHMGPPAFDNSGSGGFIHRKRRKSRTGSNARHSDHEYELRAGAGSLASETDSAAPLVLSVTTFRLNRAEIVATLIAANVVMAAMRYAHVWAWVGLVGVFNVVAAEALATSLWSGRLHGTGAKFGKMLLVDPVLLLIEMIQGVRDASAKANIQPSVANPEKVDKLTIIAPSTIPPVGSTVTFCPVGTSEDKMPEHSWTPGSASSIRIRSLTYRKDQKKEPSAPALYDIVSFDFYRSAHRVCNIGALAPDLPKVPTPEGLPPHIPKLLIVNWQAPCYPAGIRAQENGEGFSCVLYFAIKEEAVQMFKDLDNASAGVRLLSEFFKRAIDEPDMRNRFKAICVCKNMHELGLPSMIEGCNGKPILLKHTATHIRGDNYYEIDINMHKFAYPARKGIQLIQPKFKMVAFESAFTVEGRSEDELPEIVIGVGKFNKMDIAQGHELTY